MADFSWSAALQNASGQLHHNTAAPEFAALLAQQVNFMSISAACEEVVGLRIECRS